MISFMGRQIPQTFEETVSPKHTALVVHEMLNDFISKGGVFDREGRIMNISGILPNVVRVMDEARKKSMRIIYVRFTSYADYSTLPDAMVQAQYERISKKAPAYTVDGTWGWDNIDEVKPGKGDIIVKKYRVDSFVGTNLELLLRSFGLKTMVIVGVGVGILPTVSTAYNLGFFPVAPSDCICRMDPRWPDEDAIKFISRLASVRPSQDIIKVWTSSVP